MRQRSELLTVAVSTGLLVTALLVVGGANGLAQDKKAEPAPAAAGPGPPSASASPPSAGPAKPGQPSGPAVGEKKPPEGQPKPGGDQPKPEGGEKKPGEEEKKPDKPAGEGPSAPAVQRPSAPPKPGDPEELKLQPDAEGKVRFNFTNQKWGDVLQWLADISKMSLDWQELPGDYLNLVTVESYTLDQARDMINRDLLARGYTILRRGERMSVVKLEKLNPAMVPWVKPEELDQRDPHEFVRVTFSLDWLVAESAAEELKPLKSQYGTLSPLKNTNRLEAMDAVVNLREIRQILAEEQSDTGEEQLVASFELKYTRAAEVRELLMQLMGIEEKKKQPPPQPGQQEQPQPPQQRPGQPGAPPEKKEPEVRIVADERLNTIYVNAPPDKMAVVRQAVASIDVPQAQDMPPAHGVTRMKAYRLESLDPEAVLKTLKSLGGLSVDTRFEVDKDNKAVIAYASLADHVIIASAIDKLDGGARRAQIIQLTTLRADSVARIVDYMMGGGPEPDEAKKEESSGEEEFSNPFFSPDRSSSRRAKPEKHEDRFRVDADSKGNRLLLWCNDFELAKVEELLDNLETTQQAGDAGQTIQVHRLVSLQPDPLIKTLKEMEALSVGATLKADRANRAIIVNATEADHAKIREILTRLDGSGREFQVIPLRRLEADYVAGTVTFMMTGKEMGQKSESGRGYYPWYYDRSSRQQQKQEDEFRVDADVEYNRLLLWANTMEMEEVHNLLVKLGEIPAEQGGSGTVRVLDLPPGPERDQLLEQLRRTWPSLMPNPLELPDPKAPQDEPAAPEKQGEVVAPGTTTQTDVSAGPPRFRLAQLESDKTEAPQAPAPPASGEAPAAATAAPITITEGPDGRLVISSQDTQALDRLEEVLGQMTPPRRDYDIIHLKFAEAYTLVFTLEDFFQQKDKKGNSEDDYWNGWWGRPRSSSDDDTRRLSRRRPVKFISDDATNTILVQGATTEQMRTIRDLVAIYDRPTMTDSESARKTETIMLHYAKAAVVAEAIKDVYRDLLSENDKALVNSKKKDEEQRSERSYTYILGGDGSKDKDAERKPRFKGYLSIGIDEASNTLVLSAPQFLFRDITKLIEQLDRAARPVADEVFVMRLQKGVDQAELQKKLSNLLQGSAPPSAPSPSTPSDKATPANGPAKD